MAPRISASVHPSTRTIRHETRVTDSPVHPSITLHTVSKSTPACPQARTPSARSCSHSCTAPLDLAARVSVREGVATRAHLMGTCNRTAQPPHGTLPQAHRRQTKAPKSTKAHHHAVVRPRSDTRARAKPQRDTEPSHSEISNTHHHHLRYHLRVSHPRVRTHHQVPHLSWTSARVDPPIRGATIRTVWFELNRDRDANVTASRSRSRFSADLRTHTQSDTTVTATFRPTPTSRWL